MRTVCGLLFLSLLVVFSGCGEDESCPTTPQPPVEILSLVATPDSVAVGGTVTLRVTAQGEDLTYEWTAPQGTFLDAEGDSAVWKAPDEPATVRITAVVSNPEGTAARSVVIGVEQYVPSVVPYYLGVATCGECHADEDPYVQWQGTAHAEAWASLQESPYAQEFCYACHTVGYGDTDENGQALDNGGYDETPISKLENVQCESCHGPLGDPEGLSGLVNHDYLRTGPDLLGVGTEEEPEGCGTCHRDEHHPYMEDWLTSGHAKSADQDFVITNPNCTKCHTAQGFLDAFVSGGTSGTYGDETLPVTCVVCHDPHDPTHEGQLRADGADIVCGWCHTSGDVLPPDTPHHPQVDVLKGEGAVEYEGATYENTPHWDVTPNTCATCHIYTKPYGGPDDPAFTGHDYMPRPENCVACHPSAEGASSLDDLDFLTQARQELQNLLDTLAAELEAATPEDSLTEAFQNAEFNYKFVTADASGGAHNFLYVKSVIEASIADFEPSGGGR
jgi:predicted CXXCH cytochrome family protein